MLASVTESFFDMAVKLASAGAFGICIFAMLWTGWLMKTTPDDARNKQAALRNFMVMCVIIAVIAGIVSVISSIGNARQVAELSAKVEAQEKNRQDLATKLAKIKEAVALLVTTKGHAITTISNKEELAKTLVNIDEQLQSIIDSKGESQ